MRYLETLTISQGRRAGEPLELMPWQRRFIRGALAPGVTRAALSLGRGNGKSSLVAALACAYLDGPLAVPRGDVVVVASSFSQARIVFDAVLGCLGGAGAVRVKGYRVSDNQNLCAIQRPDNGARIRCIGSDPKRAHGLQPVVVLADEPAQWDAAKADRMLAALVTSGGKLPGFKVVALGTRPADAEHWFGKWLDGGADYVQLHAAADASPPFTRRTWAKANPSLAAFPDLADAIAAEAKRAKADAGELAAFRALRLNQGTSDVARAELLSADVWASCIGDGMPDVGGPFALGVDLGSGAAMSAAAAYWPRSGRLETLAAFPEEPPLERRERNDHTPARMYRRMQDRGEIVTCGKRVVDVAALLKLALDAWGPPGAVVCDRWREAELRQALDAAAIPNCDLVVRGQGWKDGGEDVRTFRAACIDGRVKADKSLLMAWAMGGACVVTDAAGNAKLAKRSEGGRRQGHRDDAVAAAILAVAEGSRRGASAGPSGLRLVRV